MGQVSAFLRNYKDGFVHWCPGCEELHAISVTAPNSNGARWAFNSDFEKPTFSPSVNIRVWGGERGADLKEVCHYFLNAGQLQFCPDTTHALSGQTVPLPPIPAELAD